MNGSRGRGGNGKYRSRRPIRYQNRFNNNTTNFDRMDNEEFLRKLFEFIHKKDIKGLSDAILGSQRFIALLNSNISDDLLCLIIKLIGVLLNSAENPNKHFIVKVVVTFKFSQRINAFLNNLATDDKIEPKLYSLTDGFLKDIATILDTALSLIPMATFELVKMVLKILKVVLPVLKAEKPVDISESTEKEFRSIQNVVDEIEKIFEKQEFANDNSDLSDNETKLLDNYRKVNIFPENGEILVNQRSVLRKNVVDRPYASVSQYLDIHFRLLREDFINPIREDICDYRRGTNRRLFNIKIHNNVKFLERIILRDCRAFRIQFHVPQWMEKSIDKGERQKRFLNGALLLFTNDNFKTIIHGKVVETRELKNGRVLVDIPVGTPQIDQNYTMIECVLFFEPYHQVLKVFQKLSNDHLPMEDYVIKIDTSTCEPEYMEDVEYVNNIEGLNPSQETAHHAAMTREFVIIQGPPGTGKTFLGMKIVEEILTLRDHWHDKGPILIICFTNHALDQFLGGLRKVTDKVARLGGKFNGLMELSKEFGPESMLLDLLDDQLKHEKSYYETHGVFCGEGECKKDDCDYRSYRQFLGMLKSGTPLDYANYNGAFSHMIDQVPIEVKSWLKEKKRLTQSFIANKHAERDVRVVHKSIHVLKNLKATAILKTSFLFAGQFSGFYYHFDDFQLAGWLLCDDGTIQSEWETVDNVGKNHMQKSDELHMIYNMLSDCLGDWIRSSYTQEFLKLEDLNNYRQFIEDFIAHQPYSRQLDPHIEYLDFVTKKTDYLRMCLSMDFGPPEVDFNKFRNPFHIPCKNRWQIYNQWLENKKALINHRLEELMDTYQQHFLAHNILRETDNVRLLKRMDIVGMTTTCAAKMRSTLEALKSPIVVVEEAAEVLESHIIAALTDGCQHLVLLGDHKQLRPTTADYTIEKKYNLGISLFERMVMNNVQCHTLNVQHRMRPEISKLLKPTFYEDLQDSESVKCYPEVYGIAKNLYFIDHREPEEPYGDSSKMNRHEAEFIIQLSVHLLNNDYQPEEITILAAYLGQVHVLKEEKNKCSHPLMKDVHITPVDNFQGEENRIILLSLVRSNFDNNIGFLAVDNRVCVALSRAREGFFIMGNMSVLCTASKIWKPIKSSLEAQKAIGSYLPLQCRNHKDFITLASKPSDFAKVPEGGCDRQCDAELGCGHMCTRKCHGYDLDHENYVCKEICNKSVCDDPDHKCSKPCFEDCGSCSYLVKKKFDCGHINMIACSIDPEDSLCETQIRITPEDCQHNQVIPCHSLEKFKCDIRTEHSLSCGHKQMIPCGEDVDTFECQQQYKVELSCDHSIVAKCHMPDDELSCKKECNAQLECGHLCTRKCHKNDDPEHKQYKCEQPCLRTKSGCNYPKRHPKCNLLCHKPCEPCKVETLSISTTCSHRNKAPCYLAKVETGCQKHCNKLLSCGHNCQKLCYQDCGSCEQKTYKIAGCGHNILVGCNETPLQSKCENPCENKLKCGHKCPKSCKQECISSKQCKERCSKILDCGHPCIKFCKEDICACKNVLFEECKHWEEVKCTDKELGMTCKQCQVSEIIEKLEDLEVSEED